MSHLQPSHPDPKPTRAFSHATSSTAHSTVLQTPVDEKAEHFIVDVQPSNDSKSPLPTNHPLPTSPLVAFHSALGIPPPQPPKPRRNVLGRKKPVPAAKQQQPHLSNANRGLYPIILANEKTVRLRYQFCNIFMTTIMFLQIIVGAAVTAFGAGNADHTLVTVFGAGNTALATLLAVMKSQGLPNRLRQDWTEWRDLKEFVDAKERHIEMWVSGRAKELGDCSVEDIRVWDIIKEIQARYEAVRITAEANRPDTYIRMPVR